MAWQDEMTTILRVLLNDTGTTQTYSDDQLEQALVVAARQVLVELAFPTAFSADVVNISITPDPTDDANNTRDNTFIDLVTLKTACINDRGAALTAAGQAIMVRDGSSQVDLRDAFKAKLALLAKGWCAVYDARKDEYLTGQAGNNTVGAIIMTPIRIFASCGGSNQSYLAGGNPRWWR